MSLHILYGSSLSGRAGKLYDTMLRRAEQNPARNYIVLVPEQASLTVQQELVERSPRHALFNIDVLTFNRLAFRVFGDTGEKLRDVLDDIGKSMLLRLVVSREQKELLVLKRNLNRKGFIDELKSLISELAQYNVSPERLRESAEQIGDHPLLSAKAKDVASLYGEFLALLHEDYELAEERLVRLSETLPRWEKARDTEILLEGFTGFTPPQYEVIGALLACCPEVYLGAVLGSGRDARAQKEKDDLFCMSARMAEQCRELAIRHSVLYEEARTGDPEGEEALYSPEIRHIERAFSVYPVPRYPAETSRIRLLKCRNREEETETLLSEILASVRRGYAYRDMAVICGDPASYRELLEDRFGEASVPLFIDAVKPLETNPLLTLVTEALAVAEHDFLRDDVIALGKNPLICVWLEKNLSEGDPLDPYERISEFENFLLMTGIRGHLAYGRSWSSRSRRFAEIRKAAVNETRSLIAAALIPLYETLGGRNSAAEKTGALRAFLQAVGAEQTMSELASAHEAAGELLLCREYENTFALLSGLFDRAEELLRTRVMDIAEFSEVLETGIAKLDLGMVPPTRDRLVVGDLERTRLGRIRKLFVLGAGEGMLPRAHEEGGIFSDSDRELLLTEKLELAPTSREEGFNQQFYLYLLLTRPEESVFLTWPAMDVKGKALLKSPLVETLEQLFPVRTDSGETAFPLSSPKGALRALASGLRERKPGEAGDEKELGALFRWFSREKNYRSSLQMIAAGLCCRYKREVLPAELSRTIFGERLTGSASELEKFAGCAFAHFLNFGLELREREEHVVTGADLGNILHASVDLFFRKLKEEGLSWVDLSDEKLRELTELCVSETAGDYGDELLSDNARNRYLQERVKRLTLRTLSTLRFQWEHGEFTESLTEAGFSGSEELPELLIPLGKGLRLSLQGRIDRLDLCEDGNSVYVKVIDYKSGDVSPDYTRIYYGLQLQLLLYLEAAKAIVKKRFPSKAVVPAGFYYYHLDDPIVDYEEGKDPEAQILKALRMRGITNSSEQAVGKIDAEALSGESAVVHSLSRKKDGEFSAYSRTADTDELEALGSFALRKAGELASDILSGNVSARPKVFPDGKSSCGYCPFRGVCGFDERIPGFSGEKLRKRELKDLTGASGGKGENSNG